MILRHLSFIHTFTFIDIKFKIQSHYIQTNMKKNLSILAYRLSIKSFLSDWLANTSTSDSIPNSIYITTVDNSLNWVLDSSKTRVEVNITRNANSVKNPQKLPKNVIALPLFLCLIHSLVKNFLMFPLLCVLIW